MTREPIYIDPYQKRIAQLQGLEMPQLGQHAVTPYLQNRGAEPMASNAQYADVIGDHNAYLANQQRLAAQNAWNAQQQAAGLATNANFEALKQEKAENMVKISQLKAELAKLQTTLGDEDAFSRELAANRAKIGDIAASRAHQQDIANRFQWKWQAEQNEKSRNADKDLQKRKEIQTLVGNIEDLDVMLAAPQMDSGTRDALLVKRKRLERELKALGQDYTATNVAPPSPQGSVKTVAQLNEDFANMLNRAYKKQHPKKSEIEALRSEVDKLQDSAQKNDLITKLNQLKDEESVKAGAAKAAKANQAAVDEIASNISLFKLRNGKGSYTSVAKNGKTVSVTKNPDGTVTVRSGNKSKVVNP